MTRSRCEVVGLDVMEDGLVYGLEFDIVSRKRTNVSELYVQHCTMWLWSTASLFRPFEKDWSPDVVTSLTCILVLNLVLSYEIVELKSISPTLVGPEVQVVTKTWVGYITCSCYDRRVTRGHIAQELDTCIGTVHNISHDSLQMAKLSVRWVPRIWPQIKRKRIVMLRKNLALLWADPVKFKKRMVTLHEIWVPYFTPEHSQNNGDTTAVLPRGKSPSRLLVKSWPWSFGKQKVYY